MSVATLVELWQLMQVKGSLTREQLNRFELALSVYPEVEFAPVDHQVALGMRAIPLYEAAQGPVGSRDHGNRR